MTESEVSKQITRLIKLADKLIQDASKLHKAVRDLNEHGKEKKDGD